MGQPRFISLRPLDFRERLIKQLRRFRVGVRLRQRPEIPCRVQSFDNLRHFNHLRLSIAYFVILVKPSSVSTQSAHTVSRIQPSA